MAAESHQSDSQKSRIERPASTVSADADTDDVASGHTLREYASVNRVSYPTTERAVLRARVTALERTLERRERQHQRVIERYEAILANRGDAQSGPDGDAADSKSDDDSTLRDYLRSLVA